jgi:hypothetical protein
MAGSNSLTTTLLAVTFLILFHPLRSSAAGLDGIFRRDDVFPSSSLPPEDPYILAASFAKSVIFRALERTAQEADAPLTSEIRSAHLSPEHIQDVLWKLRSLRPTRASDVNNPPYFGFIPTFIGRSLASGSLENAVLPSCNTTISVSITNVEKPAGKVHFHLQWMRSASPSAANCEDQLLFTIAAKSTSFTISSLSADVGSSNLTIAGLSGLTDGLPEMEWDLATKGVRVFRMRQADSPLTRFLEVLDTALLFLPMLTGVLDETSAIHNVDFLSNYSLMTPYPVPRAFNAVVPLNESYIRDGDLFAKMELDGLGPVEGFAQGTTSGHTAFAIRNHTSPTKELLVCESVAIGITCTPYQKWIVALQAAGAAVVLVPLAPAFSAAFNVTSAWSHINAMLGNSYGFFNFFFGWVDTEDRNYPCLPWAFEQCLSYDIVEYFFLLVDEIVPEVSNMFFGQALNHRANTGDLAMPIAKTLYVAATGPLRMQSKKLMTVPESDAWRYNSTKRGVPGRLMLPSQVCSSFACSTLRAAGVFDAAIGGNITCTEIDVWDIFSLKIFDESKFDQGRPEVCRTADPKNSLCQLSGSWTFHLVQDKNSRPLKPQMSLSCASRNPSPYDHSGC